MRGAPGSLLFVCGENALRSPMAEAMVNGNTVIGFMWIRWACGWEDWMRWRLR